MPELLTLQDLERSGVIPSDGIIRSLYEKIWESLDITLLDCLTIRDLVQISGCGRISEEDLGLLHLLLIGITSSLKEGSLCMNCSLPALVHRMEQYNLPNASETAVRIRDKLHERHFSSLIADDPEAFLPLIYVRDKNGERLYFQLYYRHEALLREDLNRLLNKPRRRTQLSPEDAGKLLGDVLEKNPLRDPAGSPLLPDDHQKMALLLGLTSDFCIISGGPGTGKTSLVVNLLRCIARREGTVALEGIRLAAPTGRAARRLVESVLAGLRSLERRDTIDQTLLAMLDETEVPGATLHRLLGYSPGSNSFLYGPLNPLPAGVLIIDEVSMVDVIMMSRLLGAVGPNSRVILLGDRNQLPSVEAGAVLADMMPRDDRPLYSPSLIKLAGAVIPRLELEEGDPAYPFTDRVVLLARSYRSTVQILETADSINALRNIPEDRLDTSVTQIIQKLTPLDLKEFSVSVGDGTRRIGCFFAEMYPEEGKEYRDGVRRFLDVWAEEMMNVHPTEGKGGRSYWELVREVRSRSFSADQEGGWNDLLKDIFLYLQNSRILTVLKRGAGGAEGVNAYLAERIRMRDAMFREDSDLFPGEPVMITRNDYRNNLFNGDMGVILKDDSSTYRAFFPSGEGYAGFAVDRLPRYERAFAMTVHKSQGSEYGHVLILLPAEEQHPLMKRELLYTALTRARKQAVICGRRGTLFQGLMNRTERESGLGWFKGIS